MKVRSDKLDEVESLIQFDSCTVLSKLH